MTRAKKAISHSFVTYDIEQSAIHAKALICNILLKRTTSSFKLFLNILSLSISSFMKSTKVTRSDSVETEPLL